MAGTFVSDTIQDGAGNSTSTTNCIQGSAKAWLRTTFNGTVQTINASYNISSITRTAAGNYTIALTNALADANYSVISTAAYSTSYTGLYTSQDNRLGTQTSSTFYLGTYSTASAYTDTANLNVSVFR